MLTDLNPADIEIVRYTFLQDESNFSPRYELKVTGTSDGIWLGGIGFLSEIRFADDTVWDAAAIAAAAVTPPPIA